ncbi:aspartyl-phosphate phosphatase Spo0E family protein [Natranaerofaba carboxydovora]|uniref:aspartyl-phosphate phosphatase Spo0E family protein n=1 Tax=Natranaerofaba carboxydovora TaxID=2742683 RepID=UPI001F12E81C|nr:aspartyl-phosphate phosphatase Spo0E family protein [Natranaerofaba carboxydovora]UMZ72778.1 Spo0E like sporulation regulatory protein [Natranaerofaba carboxydovora]
MELQKTLEDIERIRDEIKDLVQNKGSFQNPEVIQKSKELDVVLNKYNEISNIN